MESQRGSSTSSFRGLFGYIAPLGPLEKSSYFGSSAMMVCGKKGEKFSELSHCNVTFGSCQHFRP